MGSWLSYGLGSQNRDLPDFVVMVSGGMPSAGKALWDWWATEPAIDVAGNGRYARQLVEEGFVGEIRQVRAQYLQDWLSDADATMIRPSTSTTATAPRNSASGRLRGSRSALRAIMPPSP